MRHFAKLLSFALLLVTLVSVCTFAASAEFKDVPVKDEELYEAVELLNSLGIAKGKSETSYGTKEDVTREQMAAFIYRMMNKGKSIEGGENLTKFTDLEDDTFYYMISWADAKGIIKGRSETEFDPWGDITLQDCYVMITRMLGYEKDGALTYPHGYIDVAETIGLDENVDSDIAYTDTLTRGDVAIILYNAFYADMNETRTEIFTAVDETNGNKKVTTREVHDNVCNKIYGIKRIVRRIVATPGYALDLSRLYENDNELDRNEYKAYTPVNTETMGDIYVETAAIVPEESSERLEKEDAFVKFSDLGFDGEADDYFLRDVVMFVDGDGKIFAAKPLGTKGTTSKITLNRRSSSNWLDYFTFDDILVIDKNKSYERTYKKDSYGIFYSGSVTFDSAKGYLYDVPSQVPNKMVSICPVSNDDGKITFKADYMWNGTPAPDFERGPFSEFLEKTDIDAGNLVQDMCHTKSDIRAWLATHRELHFDMIQTFGIAARGGDEALYSMDYYDTNGDNIVDYFWFQPYTFGYVVERSGESNETVNKHVGDSKYRAVFNSAEARPEIVISKAEVEGEYTLGNYAFAYVAGPANIVKFAPADIQSKAVKRTDLQYVTKQINGGLKFDDGTVLYVYDSARKTIVGHVNLANNGLVSMAHDAQRNGTTEQYSGLDPEFGDYYDVITLGNRVLTFNRASFAHTDKLMSKYAFVTYVNEETGKVVQDAGGIEADGTLNRGDYVGAYIDGEFRVVKIAEKFYQRKEGANLLITQDNDYFTSDEDGTPIVGNISVYSLNGDGEYIFERVNYNNDDDALASADDETKVYSASTTTPVVIEHVKDKVYRFVTRRGDVPAALAPNGTKYYHISDDSKIIIKYISEDGYSEYASYNGKNLPKFDINRVQFTKTAVVVRNNKGTTQSEYLDFLYAEIGGEIIQDKVADKNYAIVLGSAQHVKDNGDVITKYTIVNPYDGTVTEDVAVSNESNTRVIENFWLYKLTTDGLIQNSGNGKEAYLAAGSDDITTVEEFDASIRLLILEDKELLVNDETVYVLLDREKKTLTVEDIDMLSIEKEEDTEDKYYNTTGDVTDKLTVYVTHEEIDDEDLEVATLIIVVRG